MKKYVSRFLSLMLAVAMVMSMGLTAAAAENTTWIRVSIEDDEGGPNGQTYRVFHWCDSSHYLTEESPLLMEIVAILNKMYDPNDRTTPLWDFDSKAMKQIMDEGLSAYARGEAVWQDYVDEYYTDVNPVEGMRTLKDLLRDRTSVLGDLVPNVAHKISFRNEIKSDSKYGVTYTVTVTRYVGEEGGQEAGPVPELAKTGEHPAYVIGYPDGTVRPTGTITRAEVATIFFRLLTDESRSYYWAQESDFSDVKQSDWFNTAVSTMSAAGIIKGYPDGTFRPQAPVTRSEFAAIATRFTEAGRSGAEREFKAYFKDVRESDWFADAVELASELGWAQGYDGSYRPGDNMSRAEVMTMINRILDRGVKEENMLADMVVWPDNTPDMWYYEAVQEATNSHACTRTDEQVPNLTFFYEVWQALTENPDWAALEKVWKESNNG